MESVDTTSEEHHTKKGRHRKKLLYSSILRQMEFYFSDSNLSKDRFLSKLLEESDTIELVTFLKFNKIRKLTSSVEDIIKALQTSELLEISEDKIKIRRKVPLTVKENIDDCTIYVEHIKSDTTHEWVSSVFSEFGKVQYVSLPKYKHNKLNKGFAFVEFEHQHEAHKALEYFESIGLKMPSHMEPDKLCSISTFGEKEEVKSDDKDGTKIEGDKAVNETNKNPDEKICKEEKSVEDEKMQSENENKKRKHRESDEHDKKKKKKAKTGNNSVEKTDSSEKVIDNINTSEEKPTEQISTNEEHEEKKKKKKTLKRKAYFKELGLQILSKDEWRKMRNKYLNNQRKKMQLLKQHLHKRRYQNEEKIKMEVEDTTENVNSANADEKSKLEFTPGVIVKLKLSEPCYDMKKTKTEIKNCSSNIQYIDIPQSSGSEEVYVRFTDNESAKQFLNSKYGEVKLLEGDEEQSYWDKIKQDRNTKVNKEKKKLRGREKLLKKAERELGKHIRFDEEN